MVLDFGRTRQDRWARGAGMALCLLVVVFSFAAKLSWYQPKGVQMHSLTSSKMWQHEAKAAAAMLSAPDDSGSTAPLAAVVSTVFLLIFAAARLGMGSPSSGEWLEREVGVASRRTLFARVSQLRAPPVR